MKVLVLNPPFLPKFSRESRSPAVTKSGTLYYPMWLAYAVGYLEKNNHEVLFIDAPAQGITQEEIIERAQSFNPQMAIVEASTPSIYNDVDIACSLKKAIPSLFTILVGVHVSAVPEETLRNAPAELNAVAIHEYDATLVELANQIERHGNSDKTLKDILGIAYKKKDGTIIRNPDRPFIDNLDALPMVSAVYKKHLDIKPYFYSHSRHPIIVLLTGRGCPFRCTYCVYPQTLMGHQYRKRSIISIVQEFRYIQDNFSEVKEIMIEDDTITADKNRCRELAQALIDAGANRIPWSANSRADVDLDTMRIMKKANCRLFCVGFESGNQSILDNIKKSITVEQFHRFMKNTRKAGILVHGCFMVGNQGETNETLANTLALAKKLNPDTAQFFPIMVYPGTEAYEYFRKQGWITTTNYRDWVDKEGLHSSVVSNPDLSYEQLINFCDNARKSFYLRPGYIVKKLLQIIIMPRETKRLLIASQTFYKYLFKPLKKVD